MSKHTPNRRTFLAGTGGALLGSRLATLAAGSVTLTAAASTATASAGNVKPVRWGIVGTGGIANNMAPHIHRASGAELAAISSRSMDKAKEFAGKHDVPHSFDSWADMIASDTVDAIYCATPTSVREEICVAAAEGGKHVLGEKPFLSLPTLRNITAACRQRGLAFLDGTHFVHHPRSKHITANMGELVGQPNSVASAFQFGLNDTNNIRLRPDLEPMGAIGDTGWYNMKAVAEYLPDWFAGKIELVRAETFANREAVNKAVNRAAGTLLFSDGSTSTWNCGFESGSFVQGVRISGDAGVLIMDDYIRQRPADEPADFELRKGWGPVSFPQVPADKPEATLMFESFALMVADLAAGKTDSFEHSVRSSERTQELLDAVFSSALENEKA